MAGHLRVSLSGAAGPGLRYLWRVEQAPVECPDVRLKHGRDLVESQTECGQFFDLLNFAWSKRKRLAAHGDIVTLFSPAVNGLRNDLAGDWRAYLWEQRRGHTHGWKIWPSAPHGAAVEMSQSEPAAKMQARKKA